jgi:hypothetical protein
MSFKRDELLTASEVARYIYCKRAWWYDRQVRIRQRDERLLGMIRWSLRHRLIAMAIVLTVLMVLVLIQR